MAARNIVRISFDSSDDTVRCSFIPHLSAAFSRKSISLLTNKDGEVCESAASLLVFSKNYMSSTEFLAQLMKAIQWRRDKDHMVTAIFYGVSRSNVQELKGIFDKGFFEKEILERLSQWRTALAEIPRLPAHEPNNNQRLETRSNVPTSTNQQAKVLDIFFFGSDSDFVEEISRAVYEKIFPKKRIGVYSRMLPDVENLVCKQQWGVKSIGFWGMPGIGKTMLAKAVFDQMSCNYDVTCLLENFHETFQEKGLYRLMEEHFKNHPNQKIKQRVLVVLDDVRNHLDAESFLGRLDFLSHGSLIIVTSRDAQVLTQCRVNQTYKVEGLSKREAQQLFSWCAFERDVTEKNPLTELSREVIEYANGNPLALRLYGEEMSSLHCPNQKETFLLKLKKTPPHQIVEGVKSSYYALSENEKNILMYIALFFTGNNTEYVSTLLQDLGFFPDIGIHRLVENSLVTISENRLEMHSMVQAVVREIGQRHQLKIKEDSRTSFKCVLGTKDFEAISLDASIFNQDVNLSSVGSMYNLIFLKIYNSNPEDRCEALKSLPYGLRFLHWENYPLQSLPQDFDTSNLVELTMPCSQLQRLWGENKNLKMLKRINLSYSKNLTEVKELSEALNLEQINLCGCTNLKSNTAIRTAILLLKKLRVAELPDGTRIKNMMESPSNVELRSHVSSSIKEDFPPDKLADKSLHEHLDNQKKPHVVDPSTCRTSPSSPKRTTYVPPTLKSMIIEKGREMGKILQLKLKKYEWYKIIPSYNSEF